MAGRVVKTHLRILALIASLVFGNTPASALDANAVAAAQRYFEKFDRGDFAGAYGLFSAQTKSVVPFDVWLASYKKPDRVVSRRFTKSVTYDRPKGVLVAVEFDGTSAGGDRECGYIVVDAKGSVVRVDSTRIPAEAITSGADGELSKLLKDLPGCH